MVVDYNNPRRAEILKNNIELYQKRLKIEAWKPHLSSLLKDIAVAETQLASMGFYKPREVSDSNS